MSIGTSTLYSTEWVIERLRLLKPASIIDIGCGWGRWGFLAREFLELWEHRYAPEDWKLHIAALDVHPGTWTPIHVYLYDETIQADVSDWEPSRRYDVAVLCDVLEHMPKQDAEGVLAMLLGWCGAVLVGVPLGAWPLRAGFDGNPHEAHVARWDESDFDPYDVEALKITQTEDRLGYGLFDLRSGVS